MFDGRLTARPTTTTTATIQPCGMNLRAVWRAGPVQFKWFFNEWQIDMIFFLSAAFDCLFVNYFFFLLCLFLF